MSNIRIVKPWSIEKNLGKAYNEEFKRAKPGEWLCLMDYDSCFLDPSFYSRMTDHIKARPDTGIFTCYTNRVGRHDQCFNGDISRNGDIVYWRKIARNVSIENKGQVKEVDKELSGFCMLIKKGTWLEVGGFKEKKILGIDNYFSWDVMASGKKILLMCDVFAFHYYRLYEGISYKKHLL